MKIKERIDDMKRLDVLGSWRIEEKLLERYYPKTKKIELRQSEPYFSEDPRTQALEGKKVLVVHPFTQTIEKQYREKCALLFNDPRILLESASLQTIKAVQTIAGEKSEFSDWFAALDYMKEEYRSPLAAHVKRMGKKAIHLGGARQILFGIKGSRWEEDPTFKNIINEHLKVEGGCYW